MRKVRYFLSSFRVVVEVDQPVGLERLYDIREVVSRTFRDAQVEYVPNANVLDSPVHPHVFVSQIRHGSLDLQVIYQALVNLPSHEIIETVGHIANQGIVVIEHIGKIVAALETMKRIGPWIQKRLHGSPERQDKSAVSQVTVSRESALETDPHALSRSNIATETARRLSHDPHPHALSNSNIATETARKLLHDRHPRAVIVLLDEQSITVVRNVLSVSVEQSMHHLGGRTIIHDMNLMMNGISNLNELREDDAFCLQNPGAMGLNVARNNDSLFDACAPPDSDLRIDDVTMNHIDFPEEHRIVDGPSIDVDDLPSQ